MCLVSFVGAFPENPRAILDLLKSVFGVRFFCLGLDTFLQYIIMIVFPSLKREVYALLLGVPGEIRLL